MNAFAIIEKNTTLFSDMHEKINNTQLAKYTCHQTH